MFLVIVLLAVLGYYVYNVIKYRRPEFPLTYLIGKKGTGKSTVLARLIKRHVKQDWLCYTTNRELVSDNCKYIPFKMLGKVALPPHSCLFWDEASLDVFNRNFKNFDTDIRDWLVYMRHYGNKVYIVSQSYNIDKSIKDLVDVIYLLSSPLPLITIAQKVNRKITVATSSDGESKITESLFIQSPLSAKKIWQPAYYKYFDSFSKLPDLPVLSPEDDPETYKPVPLSLRKAQPFSNTSGRMSS